MDFMDMYRQPAVIASQQAVKLARQGRFAEAIPFYEEALALTPHLGLWHALAYALLMDGRYVESLAAYDKVIELDRDALRRGETGAHIQRVSILISLKRLDEALAAADAMITQSPRNSDSWVCRGAVYAALKRYGDAEDALLTAVHLAPSSRLALAQLANFYSQDLRDFDRALEVCESLLAAHPSDEYAWEQKGLILFAHGSFQESADAYVRALECKVINPTSRAQIWCNYGLSLLHLGRCFDALAAFDRGESLVPRRKTLLNNRGVAYCRIDRLAEALEQFEAAILADSSSITPRINKAESLTYLGRYDEAESLLSEVLAEEPESFGAWCARGLLATWQGYHDEAMAAFKRSFELFPHHGPTYMELAVLLLDLDDASHACRVAERATTLDPYYARAWWVKAQALRAAGRSEEADTAEQRATELLVEQTAQVDAYLRSTARHDASDT